VKQQILERAHKSSEQSGNEPGSDLPGENPVQALPLQGAPRGRDALLRWGSYAHRPAVYRADCRADFGIVLL